ncbi:hypothetical protein WKI71_04005 [Streptomyces sp. MS1.AVA.1]|uniref:Uncharacterized protein n=1 Tax=Streptomyces machairae TaxID=3134109 RepID=A0ABU8UGI3_9ACTN
MDLARAARSSLGGSSGRLRRRALRNGPRRRARRNAGEAERRQQIQRCRRGDEPRQGVRAEQGQRACRQQRPDTDADVAQAAGEGEPAARLRGRCGVQDQRALCRVVGVDAGLHQKVGAGDLPGPLGEEEGEETGRADDVGDDGEASGTAPVHDPAGDEDDGQGGQLAHGDGRSDRGEGQIAHGREVQQTQRQKHAVAEGVDEVAGDEPAVSACGRDAEHATQPGHTGARGVTVPVMG